MTKYWRAKIFTTEESETTINLTITSDLKYRNETKNRNTKDKKEELRWRRNSYSFQLKGGGGGNRRKEGKRRVAKGTRWEQHNEMKKNERRFLEQHTIQWSQSLLFFFSLLDLFLYLISFFPSPLRSFLSFLLSFFLSFLCTTFPSFLSLILSYPFLLFILSPLLMTSMPAHKDACLVVCLVVGVLLSWPALLLLKGAP